MTRIVAAALVAGVLGAGVAQAQDGAHAPAQRSAEATAHRTTVMASPADVAMPPRAHALPDFTALVRNSAAAVVSIRVASRTTPAPSPADPPSRLDWVLRGLPGAARPDRPQRGVGSGFLVDADGTLLANAHIIDGAQEIVVRLNDRREFPARVVGTDAETDVAVLRIDASGLPVVRTGNPGALQAGQWVVAIGSPYGLEPTVSAGIVNATSRSLPNESWVPFIQTDVAVNPGTSGGPLLNLDGEVVGITSQIYSQAAGWQGLSFAIPIDVALEAKAQIVATGRVARGRLGVSVQEVDDALARSFGLDGPRGALVTSVDEGGGAARAGLRPGDIVLAVGSLPVLQAGDLARAIAGEPPGTEVRLEVWRDGDRMVLAAGIGSHDEGPDEVSSPREPAPSPLGLVVRPLSAGEREASGMHTGVVVEETGGAAARAGIHPGDVILAINGTPLKDPDQLHRLLENRPRQVALLVQRGDARLFVPIRLA